MKIINIGDELLIGQVINSNAAYIAERMGSIGLPVDEIKMIGDDPEQIRKSIEEGFKTTDLLILTGGLGPTKDDMTKDVIADYFNVGMVTDELTLNQLNTFMKERGIELSESNRRQSEIPEGSKALLNKNGTAPGIWVEKEGKVLVSLPGVPFEMKAMMEETLLPLLICHFNTERVILHKVVQTIGVGESTLSDMLDAFEKDLPPYIKLAYLPRPGIVRLRLTAVGTSKEELENELSVKVDNLNKIAGEYIWSYEDNQIEEVVGYLLRKHGGQLAVAESCTGGFLSHLITSVPGSSDYFKGGIVSYSNEIKRQILNVREQNLKKHGAVSEPVVTDMAINTMGLFDVDYTIAISGIAGPDGGTQDKPVGTVWIAVATTTRMTTSQFHFGTAGGREVIIQRAAVMALDMLRKEILKNNKR